MLSDRASGGGRSCEPAALIASDRSDRPESAGRVRVLPARWLTALIDIRLRSRLHECSELLATFGRDEVLVGHHLQPTLAGIGVGRLADQKHVRELLEHTSSEADGILDAPKATDGTRAQTGAV